MAKKSREEILRELEKKKQKTERHEEYLANKTFEKKPKALRRYERYSKMGDK